MPFSLAYIAKKLYLCSLKSAIYFVFITRYTVDLRLQRYSFFAIYAREKCIFWAKRAKKTPRMSGYMNKKHRRYLLNTKTESPPEVYAKMLHPHWARYGQACILYIRIETERVNNRHERGESTGYAAKWASAYTASPTTSSGKKKQTRRTAVTNKPWVKRTP